MAGESGDGGGAALAVVGDKDDFSGKREAADDLMESDGLRLDR
jgi:hypothetical protein